MYKINVTSKAFVLAFFILLAKNQRLTFVWLKMVSQDFKKVIGTEKWNRVSGDPAQPQKV